MEGRFMIERELTTREMEIFQMIKPTTFYDVVEAVRKEIDNDRYNAKRELRNLHNGNIKIREIGETAIDEIGEINKINLSSDNEVCGESI